jgi:hypothetical protein
MAKRLQVVPSSFGTSAWRVQTPDGEFLCEIRIMVSSMFNGSRYHFIDADGRVTKSGVFNFEIWDWNTIVQLLTDLVRTMAPEAEVEVLQRAG